MIFLFSKWLNKYSSDDKLILMATCAQLGLMVQKANFLKSEKMHASSLSTLYRLSHELSKLLDAKEMTKKIFPILQEEILCRRLWLGVINEEGTHLVGSGAYGPKVHGHLANIQIELNLRHDFLDEALQTKKAIIIPAGTSMECSKLNKLFEKMDFGTIVVLPLVSLGQVAGALIMEPATKSLTAIERKLPVLGAISSEIANIVVAKLSLIHI